MSLYVWTILVADDDGAKASLTVIADKLESAVVLAVSHAMTCGITMDNEHIPPKELSNVRAVSGKCGAVVAEVQPIN